MKRNFALLIVFLVLAGCSYSNSALMQPSSATKVPPPPTGAAKQLYNFNQLASESPAGRTTALAGTGPVAASEQFDPLAPVEQAPEVAGNSLRGRPVAKVAMRSVQSRTHNAIGDRIEDSSQLRPAGGENLPADLSRQPADAYRREVIKRTLQPRPPRGQSTQRHPVESTTLSVSETSTPARQDEAVIIAQFVAEEPSSGSHPKQAGVLAQHVLHASEDTVAAGHLQGPIDSGTRSDAVPRKSPGNALGNCYYYAADYTLLRGRLEYSNFERSWRIRYIPVDQKMDQFGGCLNVANPDQLPALKEGVFVELRGRLIGATNSDTAQQPRYEVASARIVNSQ